MNEQQPAIGSERELVRRVQDELPYVTEGFAVLMRAYEARVLRTCRRLLANDADAEDAWQEILLRVFHGIRRFQHDAAFSTWLFRVTRNECLDRLRRARRERAFYEPLDENDIPAIESNHVESSTLSAEITRALDQLSFKDREVLTLRYVSELSIADVARVLDIGLSAVKMRLSRASDRFRRLLEEET